MDGMKGIESDEVERNACGEQLGEVDQVGEVAYAPIAMAAKRGQKAIDSIERLGGWWKITLVGCQYPTNAGLLCCSAEGEPVVARRGELLDCTVVPRADGDGRVFPLDVTLNRCCG